MFHCILIFFPLFLFSADILAGNLSRTRELAS